MQACAAEQRVRDYTGAMTLLSSLPNAQWLLADRGYDAGWFREALSERGARPCIPGRKSRKQVARYDKRRYKRRTPPLGTLLRNALMGSDRENVRQAQSLAMRRTPL